MPWKFYLIPLAVVAICMFAAYFAFLDEQEDRSRRSAGAFGTITKTVVRRNVDPETAKEFSVDVLLSFQYEIEVTKYERTLRMGKLESSSFTPWGKAKVCYDPHDPTTYEKAILISERQNCV